MLLVPISLHAHLYGIGHTNSLASNTCSILVPSLSRPSLSAAPPGTICKVEHTMNVWQPHYQVTVTTFPRCLHT